MKILKFLVLNTEEDILKKEEEEERKLRVPIAP